MTNDEIKADNIFFKFPQQIWRSLRDDPPEVGQTIIFFHYKGKNEGIGYTECDKKTSNELYNCGYDYWIPFPKFLEIE